MNFHLILDLISHLMDPLVHIPETDTPNYIQQKLYVIAKLKHDSNIIYIFLPKLFDLIFYSNLCWGHVLAGGIFTIHLVKQHSVYKIIVFSTIEENVWIMCHEIRKLSYTSIIIIIMWV